MFLALVIRMSSPRIVGWDPGVDIDPDRLVAGVVAHRLEAHLAAIAGAAHAAEGRARIDPLVAIDPDHAARHVAGDAVGALQVARPQPAAQPIGGAVGDGDDLL